MQWRSVRPNRKFEFEAPRKISRFLGALAGRVGFSTSANHHLPALVPALAGFFCSVPSLAPSPCGDDLSLLPIREMGPGPSSVNFSRVHQFPRIRLKEDARRWYDRGGVVCTAAHPLGFAPALPRRHVPPLPAVAGCRDRGRHRSPIGASPGSPVELRQHRIPRRARLPRFGVDRSAELLGPLLQVVVVHRPPYPPRFQWPAPGPIYDDAKTCTRRPISTLHLCGRARLCLWGGC